jgi:hypothetical protein
LIHYFYSISLTKRSERDLHLSSGGEDHASSKDCYFRHRASEFLGAVDRATAGARPASRFGKRRFMARVFI